MSRSLTAIAPVLLCLGTSLRAQEGAIRGVITEAAVPVTGRTVQLQGSELATQTNSDGHFTLRGVSPGVHRLRIGGGPHQPSFRFDAVVTVSSEEAIVSVDLVPHYAATHPPLALDWRLHRSWGNALDDPADLNSWNALNERDRTLSGLLLKPVWGAALLAEAVWTPLGFGLGELRFGLGAGDEESNCVTGALLAGYLIVEAAAKGVEACFRAALWPVDRGAAYAERMILESYRESALARHASQEG